MSKNKSKTNNISLDIDALTQGKRYVFYSSLRKEPREDYKDLYTEASDIIEKYKQQFGRVESGKLGNGIQEALNFLRDSAEFERQKELIFFKNFETSHPEFKTLFNIKPEEITDDYEAFVTNINLALTGTE